MDYCKYYEKLLGKKLNLILLKVPCRGFNFRINFDNNKLRGFI